MIDFEKELSNFNLVKELDDVEEELETANTRDMLDFIKEIVDLLNRIYLKIKE
ncbi:MAG: hypothetical protein IJU86_03600 [Firmicutes bacterium]|nr:hypothetical protein [Bacillota bacterium]